MLIVHMHQFFCKQESTLAPESSQLTLSPLYCTGGIPTFTLTSIAFTCNLRSSVYECSRFLISFTDNISCQTFIQRMLWTNCKFVPNCTLFPHIITGRINVVDEELWHITNFSMYKTVYVAFDGESATANL